MAYDDGVKTRNEYIYDDQDRVVRVKTPRGQFDHEMVYGDDGRSTTLRYLARSDAVTHYTFDAHGKTLTETNGLGHTRRYERNENGTLLAETDPEDNRTSYAYDDWGNRSSVTDPEGRRTTYHYDAEGRLAELVDPAGHAWHWGYDERGNLASTVDPLGYRTDLKVNAAGQPTGFMRHDGLIERRDYDAQGQLIRLVDYRGGITKFERDSFGRIVAVTDPLGRVTRFVYIEAAEADFWTASIVVRPDGSRSTREEDPAPRATMTSVDGAGRRTVYRFGPFNLLDTVEGPLGGRVRFVYDQEKRLTQVVNQLGRTWTFARDAAGRVTRERDFDGFVVEYGYDRADRMIERRYEDGARLAFGYDRSGRLTQLDASHPSARDAEWTRYRYDECGLLAEAANEAAQLSFERDGNGRLIAETCNGRRVESTYDCCGNRTMRRIGDRRVDSRYDPLGALREIIFSGHAPIKFERDGRGRETRRSNDQGFQLDQSWDAGDRLIRQVSDPKSFGQIDGPGAGRAVDRHYRWNSAPAPTAIDDGQWGRSDYVYDDNGQVTEARHGDEVFERFEYDAAMNIAGFSDEVGGLQPWITAPGGRVTEARGPAGERIGLVYDPRGRVIERVVTRNGFRPQRWGYGWDVQDRLVYCKTPKGERWAYRYDPLGRRTIKVRLMSDAEHAWVRRRNPHLVPASFEHGVLDVWPEQPPGMEHGDAWPPVVGRTFQWDGDVVAQEAPLRLGCEADWDAATHWHFEPEGFRPLARESADGTLTLIVTDHLGTPREMLDEDGRLCWAAAYRLWGGLRGAWVAANDNRSFRPGHVASVTRREHSYGKLAIASEPEIEDVRNVCPIRFQGQWEDDETGLYYNRYRHYDPLTGTYVSSDPIRLQGGVRPHAYVSAPTTNTDPFGLEGEPAPNLSPPGAGRNGAFRAAKRGAGVPVCCQPTSVTPNFDKRGNPQPGKQYHFGDPNDPGHPVIRDDAGGHRYPDNPSHNRGPHFNDPAKNHYDY